MWNEREEAGSLKTRLPRVFITPEAKQRLDLYIEAADGEISGLGTVSRLGNDFLITAVHLFEQVCTGASTDLSSEDVAKFLLASVRAGLETDQLKLWWHSHVNMGVFWSGTDETTASRFGNGFMLAVVGNKRGEFLARLDLYEPIRLTLDCLQFEVRQEPTEAMRAEVMAEVAAKVKTPPPTLRHLGFGGLEAADRPFRYGYERAWETQAEGR